MRLQIVRIVDRGVPNKERLHLSVLQETDLSFYVVLLSRYLNRNLVVNGTLLAGFWFPNQPVQPGDQVVLLTGFGTASARRETNGSTSYFYYWGSRNTLWADPAGCAIVVEAANWATSPLGG